MQLKVEISADADAEVAGTTSKHLFVKETTGTIAQHTVKQTKVARHVEGLFASGVLFLMWLSRRDGTMSTLTPDTKTWPRFAFLLLAAAEAGTSWTDTLAIFAV
jgi:hypothetical protein